MRSVQFVHGATAFVVVAAAASLVQAAPFTPGNLVVTRSVGGTVDTAGGPGSVGAVTAPNSLQGGGVACTIFVDEYTPTGTLVQSIQMPNVRRNTSTDGAGNYALTGNGTQNNEGAITLSQDGQYFVLAGYNSTALKDNLQPGYVNVGSSTSLAVERVIGRIDMSGNVNTTTALTDVSSGQPLRSAYSTNGTDFWIGGSSGGNVTINSVVVPTQGVHYAALGASTSTQLTAGNTNQRILNGFNGQLYMSVNASTVGTRGVSSIGSGFPTALPSPPTLLVPAQLPGFSDTDIPNPSNLKADDYWFKDATTLYIADQRVAATGNDAASNGGIQKWVFDDSDNDTILEWEFKYNIALGATDGPANPGLVGAHGLAGMTNNLGQAVLFATTFDNTGANRTRLVTVTDLGGAFGAVTNIATAPDQAGGFATAFRGVEIVPVPEPTSLAAFGCLGVLAVRRWRR
jgi:hypothetical protein